MEQNRGYVNFKLLLRMGIFAAQNARPNGVGNSAMGTYLAIEDIACDCPLFQWKGMAAFSLSTQQLVSLCHFTRKTVRESRRRLLEVGLLEEIPLDCVPPEVRSSSPSYVRFYCIPEINQVTAEAVLKRLRQGGV